MYHFLNLPIYLFFLKSFFVLPKCVSIRQANFKHLYITPCNANKNVSSSCHSVAASYTFPHATNTVPLLKCESCLGLIPHIYNLLISGKENM